MAARVRSRHIVHKILYRGWLPAVLASVAVLAAAAAAQEPRPEITPGERKTVRKKDAGPRALALLRLTASGKTSLVPIAILINGKFWDASAYKASPVPMALEPGVVYEAERAGSPLGLFTIGDALHSNNPNAPNPWLATGTWLPEGAEAANKAPKAESVPVGIDASDEPPRLTRHPSQAAPPASTAPAPPPASPPASAPSSGDEPPRLTKPKEAPPASTEPNSTPPSAIPTGPAGSNPGSSNPGSSTQPAPGSTGSGSNAPSSTGSAAPAQSQPAETKAPESDSGASEGNRPRLRRGKPAAPFAGEEIPGYSKPGVAPSANAAKTASTPAALEPVQLIPAISDATASEPHSFGFEWLKDEEGERRQQITALAKERTRAYLEEQAKAQITAASPASRRAAGKKSPEPVFENMRMAAFDLWINNQPVMIFSADAHLPTPVPGGQGFQSDVQYWVLLVAYPDIYNNLHTIHFAVTDKYHLDVTPHLELIDAVDADGDGRAELLFRETSDAGTGWVIYRATADTLYKMFDSLNPE